MKTNPRETSENVIRLVNKKYNIDMVRDNCEIAVYARIYLAKKLSMINMSQKYIASIFDVSKTTIGRMITLYGYDRDKYIQYRDKFKKLEEKDKERHFTYMPIYTDSYNESFFVEKHEAIKTAIKSFKYTFGKIDNRILTTDRPIMVSFKKCEKLRICLSMTYNGKMYYKEYYCTKFEVKAV